MAKTKDTAPEGKTPPAPETRAGPGRDWPFWPARRQGHDGFREEMARFLDAADPRGWLGAPFDLGTARAAIAPFPAVDLSETAKGYEVTVELPGMEPEEVDLRIGNGTLTIRGEKTDTHEEDRTDTHVSERRWGRFQRVIPLPPGIDREAIDARFDKGVLRVSLPKSKTALAEEKSIEIKAS